MFGCIVLAFIGSDNFNVATLSLLVRVTLISLYSHCPSSLINPILPRYGCDPISNLVITFIVSIVYSSSKVIIEKMVELYERIVKKDLLIRRINIVANNVIAKDKVKDKPQYQQFDLFTNYQELDEKKKHQKKEEQEENKLQNVLLSIKNKYGKNAILKGMNLEEGGTTIDRNGQIGGHKG